MKTVAQAHAQECCRVIRDLLQGTRVAAKRITASRQGRRARVAMASLVTVACAASSSRAIEIKALVGFGQSVASSAHYRPDSWNPLTVYITGQGDTGVAQLQVTVNSGDRTTVYTRRVPLHEGQLNEVQNFAFLLRNPDRFTLFRNGSGTDISIQLLKDGRKLADKQVALPIPTNPETYNVLGLTQDSSGLNFLLKKHLGLVHKQYNPAALDNQNQMRMPRFGTPSAGLKISPINALANLQILYSDPRALPTQGQGYDMVDAIALADQSLDSLSEDQVTALKDYVRMGGLLIISGGGDLAKLKSQFCLDMLPIQPAKTVAVRALPELEARYHEPLELPEATLLTIGALKSDAVGLFGTAPGSAPLISTRSYGNGRVVFTAFDYLAPEFRGWKGAPALWRDILRSGNNAISACGVATTNARYAENQPALEDALAGKQASNAPEFGTVAVFVVLYLMLLIPVSYYILKRLDKRDLAWFTQPLLILVFTIASYVIALSIKGGMLTVNRAVIFETQANSNLATGYAQMTLYSPKRQAYDIGFGSPDDPNNPYRNVLPSEIYVPQNSKIGDQLTIDQDKATVLRQTLVKLWDKRSFDTALTTDLGGPISVTTTSVGGVNVRVTVTNNTRFTLKDCGLANQDDSQNIGDLAPGTTIVKTIKWPSHGSATALNLPDSNTTAPSSSNDTAKAPETPEVRQAKIKAGLTQTLLTSSNNNMVWNQNDRPFGQGTTLFVGWFNDPVLDIRVGGNKVAGEEANLLCVHLPVPANAPAAARAAANPFEQQPYLQLEDDQPAGARRTGIFQ